MPAETFDRSRPLYRLFVMDDGSRQWRTVERDNTPGRSLDPIEEFLVQATVDRSEWRDGFYAALEKHQKATVYSKKPPPSVLVPEGCDGVILNARITHYAGETVAMGAIYGDRKGRFYEGKLIGTSPILEGPDENGIIRTQNSTYKLVLADV